MQNLVSVKPPRTIYLEEQKGTSHIFQQIQSVQNHQNNHSNINQRMMSQKSSLYSKQNKLPSQQPTNMIIHRSSVVNSHFINTMPLVGGRPQTTSVGTKPMKQGFANSSQIQMKDHLNLMGGMNIKDVSQKNELHAQSQLQTPSVLTSTPFQNDTICGWQLQQNTGGMLLDMQRDSEQEVFLGGSDLGASHVVHNIMARKSTHRGLTQAQGDKRNPNQRKQALYLNHSLDDGFENNPKLPKKQQSQPLGTNAQTKPKLNQVFDMRPQQKFQTKLSQERNKKENQRAQQINRYLYSLQKQSSQQKQIQNQTQSMLVSEDAGNQKINSAQPTINILQSISQSGVANQKPCSRQLNTRYSQQRMNKEQLKYMDENTQYKYDLLTRSQDQDTESYDQPNQKPELIDGFKLEGQGMNKCERGQPIKVFEQTLKSNFNVPKLQVGMETGGKNHYKKYEDDVNQKSMLFENQSIKNSSAYLQFFDKTLPQAKPIISAKVVSYNQSKGHLNIKLGNSNQKLYEEAADKKQYCTSSQHEIVNQYSQNLGQQNYIEMKQQMKGSGYVNGSALSQQKRVSPQQPQLISALQSSYLTNNCNPTFKTSQLPKSQNFELFENQTSTQAKSYTYQKIYQQYNKNFENVQKVLSSPDYHYKLQQNSYVPSKNKTQRDFIKQIQEKKQISSPLHQNRFKMEINNFNFQCKTLILGANASTRAGHIMKSSNTKPSSIKNQKRRPIPFGAKRDSKLEELQSQQSVGGYDSIYLDSKDNIHKSNSPDKSKQIVKGQYSFEDNQNHLNIQDAEATQENTNSTSVQQQPHKKSKAKLSIEQLCEKGKKQSHIQMHKLFGEAVINQKFLEANKISHGRSMSRANQNEVRLESGLSSHMESLDPAKKEVKVVSKNTKEAVTGVDQSLNSKKKGQISEEFQSAYKMQDYRYDIASSNQAKVVSKSMKLCSQKNTFQKYQQFKQLQLFEQKDNDDRLSRSKKYPEDKLVISPNRESSEDT